LCPVFPYLVWLDFVHALAGFYNFGSESVHDHVGFHAQSTAFQLEVPRQTTLARTACENFCVFPFFTSDARILLFLSRTCPGATRPDDLKQSQLSAALCFISCLGCPILSSAFILYWESPPDPSLLGAAHEEHEEHVYMCTGLASPPAPVLA
jgi:hypothetical protein